VEADLAAALNGYQLAGAAVDVASHEPIPNGTRAVLRAAEGERVLIAGFVNFSAVCDELRRDPRPIHIVCGGTDGAVTLEDTRLAGALVDHLCAKCDARLNDSARAGDG
jgi:2-phosphosulfolactate phosphatase